MHQWQRSPPHERTTQPPRGVAPSLGRGHRRARGAHVSTRATGGSVARHGRHAKAAGTLLTLRGIAADAAAMYLYPYQALSSTSQVRSSEVK